MTAEGVNGKQGCRRRLQKKHCVIMLDHWKRRRHQDCLQQRRRPPTPAAAATDAPLLPQAVLSCSEYGDPSSVAYTLADCRRSVSSLPQPSQPPVPQRRRDPPLPPHVRQPTGSAPLKPNPGQTATGPLSPSRLRNLSARSTPRCACSSTPACNLASAGRQTSPSACQRHALLRSA